jgi:Ca-activated chloride channel family protein
MAAATLAMPARGQTTHISVHPAHPVHSAAWRPGWHMSVNVVMPQTRTFMAERPRPGVAMTGVSVGVDILEQVATTTLDIEVRNMGGSREEAVLVVPVPDGAVVRGFTFQGAAKEPTAEILPRDSAREIYNAIVARIRDPALLEFVGYNAIRSSVFPVEAGQTQKVRLTYECLLKADGSRVDYELPRSETADTEAPWRISVSIRSTRPLATVYSPTHGLAADRKSPGRIVARLAEERPQPGPFRLSYLLEEKGLSASLVAYPDLKVHGGYFLLLAGLPADLKPGDAIKREVTLVFDRSGSMNGDKIRQVRQAAMQVIGGLREGEAFNVIAYNEAVDLFAPRPVTRTEATARAAEEFLKGAMPRGGTNIHDALLEALRQKPTDGFLPIVLFLTDGLPTIGPTSEKDIRRLVEENNPHRRRVFTFGVGVDVNAPLLDKLAGLTRATSTYVLPSEDVEVKVGQVFERLAGPALANPEWRVVDAAGEPAVGRVRDVLPSRLPDLFHGDQLVVLGQYVGEAPLSVRLTGNYLGQEKTFAFQFNLDKTSTKNAFVPRLWAARKIAGLIDAVRQAGGDGKSGVLTAAAADPKTKELVDEIVRLSVEFGILTEYTAFLAREGTDLGGRDEVLREVERNLQARAVGTRSGLAAVNQSLNVEAQSRQTVLNRHNAFWDQNMNRVQVAQVRQVNDRAFYQQGDRWVDSRVAAKGGAARADREVRIGSPEFLALAEKLAAENRQGCVAMKGEILIEVDGQTVLCK